MASLNEQMNDIPASAGLTPLKELLEEQQKELVDIEEKIINQKNWLKEADKAILELENIIPRARAALKVQENVISSLRDMITRYSELSMEEIHRGGQEDTKQEVYDLALLNISTNAAKGLTDSQMQMQAYETDAANLGSQIEVLESQHTGWLITKDLRIRTLAQLQTHKVRMASVLQATRMQVSPVKRIPKEIWISVFHHCIDVPRPLPFTPTNDIPEVVRLSHVCRKWRGILLNSQPFWYYLVILSPDLRSHITNEAVTGLAASPFYRPTIIMDLPTQEPPILPLTYAADMRISAQDEKNLHNQLFQRISYQLLITFDKWDSYYADAVNKTAFNQPTHLRLVALNQTSYPFPRINGLRSFKSIVALRLTDISRCEPDLGPLFPQLKDLHLEYATLPRNSVISIPSLPSQLETLNIRSNRPYSFTTISPKISLPFLKNLGLKYPNSKLIQRLEAPELTHLTFYGSSGRKHRKPTWNAYEVIFSRIAHLRFHGWKEYLSVKRDNSEEETTWGAATVILDNCVQLINLEAISFIQSEIQVQELLKALLPVNNIDDVEPLSRRVTSLTFDQCNGINRADCEALALQVNKLRIFV